MGMSIRTKNILTALVAVVLVGGFIFLAEGLKNNNDSDRLAAIDDITTTTVRRTTTTRPPTTTTSTTLAPTTSTTEVPAVVTTTTIKATTKTTRASTATTRRVTTTTRPSASGVHDEAADNQPVTFTRNADGSIAHAKAPECPATSSDPLCMLIGTEDNVTLVVNLRNNTGRTISFPGGNVRVNVTIVGPDGSRQYQIAPPAGKEVATLGSGAGLRLSASTSDFTVPGQYSFTATCTVDYGP